MNAVKVKAILKTYYFRSYEQKNGFLFQPKKLISVPKTGGFYFRKN